MGEKHSRVTGGFLVGTFLLSALLADSHFADLDLLFCAFWGRRAGHVRMAKSWVQGEGMWGIMKAGPSQLFCFGAVLAAMCNWIIEIRGEG